jgi:hypothetical protein
MFIRYNLDISERAHDQPYNGLVKQLSWRDVSRRTSKPHSSNELDRKHKADEVMINAGFDAVGL